jgi:hypothetical protein
MVEEIGTVSTPLGWFFLHPDSVLFTGLALLLVVGATYILSRESVILPAPLQEYLRHILQIEGKVILVGEASSLVSQNISLSDIFIPLSFYAGQVSVKRFLHEKGWHPIPDELKDPFVSKSGIVPLYVSGKVDYSLSQQRRQVELSELWLYMSKERPAFLIQGAPGTGKSTLMAILACHMAHRNLGQPDPTIPDLLEPSLVPILFHLKDYVTSHTKSTPALSLSDYLVPSLRRSDKPLEKEKTATLAEILRKYLENGRCLVMFDGLDEVSDEETRWQVYGAIHNFIIQWNSIATTTTFNRFLITSRLASSEMGQLSDYPQYVIKELTAQQIETFVSRWFLAAEIAIGSERQKAIKETLLAKRKADLLNNLIRSHRGVQDLAQNPLLLTFLAIVQQNNIEFSKQRVDLYEVMARLLLEKRENVRQSASIPEEIAIERLGPLAYQMQGLGKGLLHQRDVLKLLQQAIRGERTSVYADNQEARDFLFLVSQKTDLFVEQADQYYGFSHRTLQEYFAARYILNTFKYDTNDGISVFIDKICKNGDLWHEPFLLAIAYDSQKHSAFADRVIKALLNLARNINFIKRQHYLLLAVECLLEARPLSISRTLEEEIVQQLLKTYQEAQKRSSAVVCEYIQKMILRWLPGLPKESYRSILLVTLGDAIAGKPDSSLQYATLLLLSKIAYEIKECPSIMFKNLLPALLQIANTPCGDTYRLSPPISVSDPALADLALTVLSFLGNQGSTGTLLKRTRSFFKQSPAYLRQLALYSLEKKILLTPSVVPFGTENCQVYQSAVTSWKELLNNRKSSSITNRDIEKSLAIHRSLLDCAEEICYPIISIFLNIFEKVGERPDIWQEYLLNQLRESKGIEYSLSILFWSVLFPEQKALEQIVRRIFSDFFNEKSSQQRNAQHFLAMISKSTPYLRDMEHLRNMRYIWYIWYISNDFEIKNIRELEDLQVLEGPPGLQNLRHMLLTCEVAEQARTKLSQATTIEQLEIFAIQLGRLLTIQKKKEMDRGIEAETKAIARLAIQDLTEKKLSETRSLSQELVSHLPVRTKGEIEFILSMAEETNDKQIQQLCALVLKQSQSKTPETWASLDSGLQAKARIIQTTVEARSMQPDRFSEKGRLLSR